MTAEEWATLTLAVIGAVTGLLALASQIWSYVGSGPRLKITVTGVLVTGPGVWAIGLDITNVGRLPVEILEVGLLLSGDKNQRVPVHAMASDQWHGQPLPARLLDGSQASWLVDPSPIAAKAQDLKTSAVVGGYVRTGTGKVIYSRRRNVQDALTLANA